MMYKLFMSVYKELLLLKRGIGGVIILFLMPLVLIVTVTMIQDSTFKKVSNSKIPILIVNKDSGKVSKSVFSNLEHSDMFTVVTTFNNEPLTEEQAGEEVHTGKYQLAIIIPEHLSADLQTKIDQNVDKILKSFGAGDTAAKKEVIKEIAQKEIRLY